MAAPLAIAGNQTYFMSGPSITDMMGHIGATVSLDVASHSLTIAEEDKTPELMVALGMLSLCPPGLGRAERSAHRIIQLCAVGFPDDALLAPEVYLPRFSAGVRSAWPSVSAAVKAVITPAVYIPYITGREGTPALAPIPLRDITANELTDLAHAISLEEGMKDHAIIAFTTGVLAFCKKGTVTQNVVRKFATALRDAKNINYNHEPDTIRQVWSALQGWFNELNAAHFFTMWERTMGDSYLALRLAIQQASWAGMTNFTNIIKAKETFPDFQWSVVNHHVPAEFANFVAARRAVGTNKYYGFKSDLGAAKSTNFINLCYIASRLLQEVGGEQTLRFYMGVNTTIPMAPTWDKMIRDYKVTREAQEATPAQLLEITQSEVYQNFMRAEPPANLPA